jgi:hypothetical protein
MPKQKLIKELEIEIAELEAKIKKIHYRDKDKKVTLQIKLAGLKYKLKKLKDKEWIG